MIPILPNQALVAKIFKDLKKLNHEGHEEKKQDAGYIKCKFEALSTKS
jgi:hypothetical protein